MEIEKIESSRLIEIRKRGLTNELTFEKNDSKRKLHLSFEGLLFETPYSPLNKKVERTQIRRVLGFKALSSLQSQHMDPSDYKQLLIEMDENNSEHKVELICVFKNYELH